MDSVKNLVTHHSSAPMIIPGFELSLASASKDLETYWEEVSPTVVGGFCPPPSACPSQVHAFRGSSAYTTGASFAAVGGGQPFLLGATEAALVGSHRPEGGA